MKNSIFKRNKSDVWSAKFLEKLFKAMKTVPPTSIEQLSILSIKNIKKIFGVTFVFLPLSKIIENYRKLSKITPEIIVIDRKISVIELSTLPIDLGEVSQRPQVHRDHIALHHLDGQDAEKSMKKQDERHSDGCLSGLDQVRLILQHLSKGRPGEYLEVD
jgi:hypothetical protein